MINPSSTQRNKASYSQPQFQGTAGKLLGAAVMLAPVVTVFSALDQKNSMFSVAIRDLFDSSGRVFQEFKRDKYGGLESTVSEISTALVWGFGIAFCKKMYDQWIPKISGGKILLPGLEKLDLLPRIQAKENDASKAAKSFIVNKLSHSSDPVPNRNDAHVLNTDVVQRYYKNTDGLALESEKGKLSIAKETHNADFASRKEHFLNLVETKGKNSHLLERYVRNNMGKLILCTTLPSLALGILIPQLLHWLTPRMMQHDREQKMYKPDPGNSNQPLSFSSVHSNLSSPFRSVQMQGSFPTPQSNQKFGSSMTQALDPAVSWLLARDTIATLLFVDFPLSGGRAATARNDDERQEIIFREAAIIGTLFWLQPAIQKQIQNAFDKKFNAHTQIEIKALHKLYQDFSEQKPHSLSFKESLTQLKEILSITKESANSLDGEKKLVAAVRQYFSDERTGGRNLLFDLAELSGKIPTLGQGSKKFVGANGKHYIDLTKKMDTDGIREIAGYLEHLQSKLSHGKSLSSMLVHNAAIKMGSFGLSALTCWAVVSYLVPKVQHAITTSKRGVSQFPGIDKN
jgi:hypothetical protein